jgi:hypothetical protein
MNNAIDIESMSSDQWLNYRDRLLDDYYKSGNVLKPTVGCSMCDVDEDDTCFQCEVFQIDQAIFNHA